MYFYQRNESTFPFSLTDIPRYAHQSKDWDFKTVLQWVRLDALIKDGSIWYEIVNMVNMFGGTNSQKEISKTKFYSTGAPGLEQISETP